MWNILKKEAEKKPSFVIVKASVPRRSSHAFKLVKRLAAVSIDLFSGRSRDVTDIPVRAFDDFSKESPLAFLE
jgi:hypothetical protein